MRVAEMSDWGYLLNFDWLMEIWASTVLHICRSLT